MTGTRYTRFYDRWLPVWLSFWLFWAYMFGAKKDLWVAGAWGVATLVYVVYIWSRRHAAKQAAAVAERNAAARKKFLDEIQKEFPEVPAFWHLMSYEYIDGTMRLLLELARYSDEDLRIQVGKSHA